MEKLPNFQIYQINSVWNKWVFFYKSLKNVIIKLFHFILQMETLMKYFKMTRSYDPLYAAR